MKLDKRQWLGVLVAPAFAPMLALIWPSRLNVVIALYVLGAAYGGMFSLGLPLLSFLRRRNWTAFWIAPLLGFLAGAFSRLVISCVLIALIYSTTGDSRVISALPSMLNDFLWPSGIFGTTVATGFWIIAEYRQPIG